MGGGGGGLGGKATVVSDTLKLLADTPSSLASVVEIVFELSVVLRAVSASEGVPWTVKDIVAVVSVVIGVDTLTLVLSVVERLEVRAFVRLAVAAASVLRLSPPDGVNTMINVTT
jgi:hypothetical protein